MGDVFCDQIQRTVIEHGLFGKRSRIIVGVSGGADSVALLHGLRSLQADWKLHLRIAHLDHGIRQSSQDDAAFVKELGLSLRVPLTIERRDVKALCVRNGYSLEDGARRIRYEFFLQLARKESASYVALAHTSDDQAETVLMRLIRGSGLLGLCAIPIKRDLEDCLIVRPLLQLWRYDVLSYLQRQHLSYREDATNTDLAFLRNRVRHELLPLLERAYNKNIKNNLVQLAQQSQLDYAYLHESAQRHWKRLAKTTAPAQVTIRLGPFLRQPVAMQRQLVRKTIERVRGDLNRFEFRHWLEVKRLFKERPVGSVVDLPGGISLQRERDCVVCKRCEIPAANT